MHDVEVIEDPAAASSALDPIRSRLLAELVERGSAAALAGPWPAAPGMAPGGS